MLNLGLGLQASLLGLRAGVEGFSLLEIGAVMSVYYLGFIYGSLRIPSIVDQVGHIRTFSVMASLASAVVLLHATWVSPWSWALLRGVTGFCLVGMSLVVESWLNEKAENQERGTILSVYMMVLLGSTAAGQLLLMLASSKGYLLFVVVSVLLSLALVPLALSTRLGPASVPSEYMGYKKLMEQSPVGVVGALSSGCLAGAFWTMGVVFAKEVGLDHDQVALFMFCLISGGLVSTWPVGWISDRMDRRYVLVILGLTIALLALLLHLPEVQEAGWVFPLVFLFGGAMLPTYAVSVALVNDQLKAGEFVPASATLLLLYGMGAAAGPLLASVGMRWLGASGIFSMAALLSVLLVLFSLYRLGQRAAVPSEELEDFVPVPRTSAAAYVMHPGAEEQ